MSARPLYAGFEPARLHWNGHCVLEATRHTPETDMARHYGDALAAGAVGFRDAMPERFDAVGRWCAARGATPLRTPIVWDLVHFDQPTNPVAHARRVARLIGNNDRLIAVNEPSVGRLVTGYEPKEALVLAGAMMGAALNERPDLQFWTCDPVHHLCEDAWAATDALVRLFGRHIEVIGVNYHACAGSADLSEVLRAAAERYPDHRIGLTETSWHDGHPMAEGRFPSIRSRREWFDHVLCEIDASGADVACVCWMPWLDMAFEPGPAWPNGWPA